MVMARATVTPPARWDGWERADSFDGTALAWRSDGVHSNAVPAVLCNGIACSDGYWEGLVPDLAKQRRVVRWDYRGHGRSDPPADPAQTDVVAVVRDLFTVLDVAAVSRAVLVGHSYGVQVILEAVRRAPERAVGLVAIAGAPGEPLGRFGGVNAGSVLLPPLEVLHRRAPTVARAAWRRLWGSPLAYWSARALRGTGPNAPRAVLDAYFTHVESLDLDVLLRMFRSMQYHSAQDVLSDLTVPLLAVAGGADGLTPVSVMQRMALEAPDGELVVIPDGRHTLPAEHPEALLTHLQRFLDRTDAMQAATR